MVAAASPGQSQAQAGARESLKFSWLCLTRRSKRPWSPSPKEQPGMGRGGVRSGAEGIADVCQKRGVDGDWKRRGRDCALAPYLFGAALEGLGELDTVTPVAA